MTCLIAGDWRAISYPDAGVLIARFQEAWIQTLPPGVHPEKANLLPKAVRAMPLACYQRTLLCEVETVRSPDDLAIAAFLYGPFGLRLINGSSSVVHDLNDSAGVLLETSEQAADYGRFFCSAVHGGEGRFEVIESEVQLDGVRLDPDTRQRIAPIKVEPHDEKWRLTGVVRYGSALFFAAFDLDREGLIQMAEDEALQTIDGHVLEGFEAPFRLLPFSPGKGSGLA